MTRIPLTLIPNSRSYSPINYTYLFASQDTKLPSVKFVELNCATLRGEQASSTLFGHTKGAFTGAGNARDGVLKRANHGVLFLDEIGELGPDEQAMLLRALEEKRFLPLGADKEQESDFQLVAGTNQELRSKVADGTFREDLFYRINTWSFELPALAARREDIEPNIEYELKKFEKRSGRRVTFSADAKQTYLKFALSPESTWTGNFRDLNASIIRMATLSTGGRITVEVVNQEITKLETGWNSIEPLTIDSSTNSLDEIIRQAGVNPTNLDLFDRLQLAPVIQTVRSAPTLAQAGRTLFNISRQSKRSENDTDRLRKYLSRFGIDARRV